MVCQLIDPDAFHLVSIRLMGWTGISIVWIAPIHQGGRLKIHLVSLRLLQDPSALLRVQIWKCFVIRFETCRDRTLNKRARPRRRRSFPLTTPEQLWWNSAAKCKFLNFDHLKFCSRQTWRDDDEAPKLTAPPLRGLFPPRLLLTSDLESCRAAWQQVILALKQPKYCILSKAHTYSRYNIHCI